MFFLPCHAHIVVYLHFVFACCSRFHILIFSVCTFIHHNYNDGLSPSDIEEASIDVRDEIEASSNENVLILYV